MCQDYLEMCQLNPDRTGGAIKAVGAQRDNEHAVVLPVMLHIRFVRIPSQRLARAICCARADVRLQRKRQRQKRVIGGHDSTLSTRWLQQRRWTGVVDYRASTAGHDSRCVWQCCLFIIKMNFGGAVSQYFQNEVRCNFVQFRVRLPPVRELVKPATP